MKQPLRKLRVSEDVAALIRGLHPQLKHKLRAALEQILSDPHSGKALRDDLAGLWSFRVGKFRVIYRVSSRYIDLITFGARERIYEDTYRLITTSTKPGSVEEPRTRYKRRRVHKPQTVKRYSKKAIS